MREQRLLDREVVVQGSVGAVCLLGYLLHDDHVIAIGLKQCKRRGSDVVRCLLELTISTATIFGVDCSHAINLIERR